MSVYKTVFALSVAFTILPSRDLPADVITRDTSQIVSEANDRAGTDVSSDRASVRPLLSATVIVLMMLLCGVLGGIAASFLDPSSSDEVRTAAYPWWRLRAIVLGVVAAMLVPLFLQLVRAVTGSNDTNKGGLIRDAIQDQDPNSWFILAGFCLIAAVYAERFLTAVSNAVISQLKEDVKTADRKAEEAQEEIEHVQDDLAIAKPLQISETQRLSDSAKKILRAMAQPSLRHASPEAIAQATGLANEIVRQVLEDELIPNKYVQRLKDGPGGSQRWRVRTAGRAVLAGIDMASEK